MNTRITEVLFLTAIANLGWVSDLAAQITPVTPNTAVAYQGRLSDGPGPAGGVYDFQFRIFNANGIFPIAGPLTITNVPVSNGLFTAHLNFDPAVWASPGNNARLLEVAVRSAGSGDFTPLSPRHPITPAPFALKTLGISGNALNAADGSPANAVFVDDAGNVGIGTGDPQSRLHVTGGMAVFDSPGGAIRVTKTAGQLSSDDLGIWNRGGNGGQPFAIADWDTGSKGIFITPAS
ncbi:MAG: hypothetical protein FJ405_00080 [Verrucomicrobia bacterium]|nr:hypothetical protein [Verrucomicrobiota bacterium]